jgi:hypothetical protein
VRCGEVADDGMNYIASEVGICGSLTCFARLAALVEFLSTSTYGGPPSNSPPSTTCHLHFQQPEVSGEARLGE